MKLTLAVLSLAGICTARLLFEGMRSANWEGVAFSIVHLAIVGLGTYLSLRSAFVRS